MPEPNYTIWQYMTDLFNQGGQQPQQPAYNSADYIGSGSYYYVDPRAAGVPAAGGQDYAGTYFPEWTPQAYLPRPSLPSPPVAQGSVEAANSEWERMQRRLDYLAQLDNEQLQREAELKRQRYENNLRMYQEELARRNMPMTPEEQYRRSTLPANPGTASDEEIQKWFDLYLESLRREQAGYAP
jgi:hypothetical protein